jgi:hypothetical protein
VLLSPPLVFLLCLGMYWFTGWLDRCEEGWRHAAEE